VPEYSFERYLNVGAAYGASFSPDGRQLTFLTDIAGVAEVWSVPVDLHASTPAWPQQLTFQGDRVAGAVFSPTENVLLAICDVGGNERTQFYALSADGSTFVPLTNRPEVMYLFGGWSPDGSRIVYSSNERDGRYFDVYERDMASDTIKQLYVQDGTNYAAGFSPDGRSVLVSHYNSNVRNQLLLADTITGEARALTPQTAEGEGPALHVGGQWSADREGLYLLSNRDRQFLSLAYLDLSTLEMIYLLDENWDQEELALTEDGRQMALVTNEDGYSRLRLFDVSNGWEARRDLAAPELPAGGTIYGLTWSQEGTRLAFTFDSPTYPPDVWVWDLTEKILWHATRSTLGGIPRDAFVAPALVRYPTFDGRAIPAFLYLPKGKEPRDLPVVIHVHGGPEGQARPIFNRVIQYLVAHGYAVLAPNVRGSTGYGYEYQSLDDVRKRMDSVADLRYAADWLRESGIANPNRIAVMGGSYGGFMVLSAITTYPDIWAAAVDIVGIANFVTFLENTGPWRRKLREAEYGSLEHDRAFLEQISPIRHVDSITAPLFVVHGANDPRVPIGEAEQIVAALRNRNVPVEYLRFEDEGHGIVKRVNRLIVYPAIARFLDQYLRGTK